MADFKGFGASPMQPPTFNQMALLGIHVLLERSYRLAFKADDLEKDNKGQEWFPLADVPEMASIPAWKNGKGFRDASGENHLTAETMATLMGMPLEHFEHHLSEELGMKPTFHDKEINSCQVASLVSLAKPKKTPPPLSQRGKGGNHCGLVSGVV